MPIPLEYESKEFNQEPLDSLLPSINSALESNEGELHLDYIMNDLTLNDIDKYIEKIKLDQDLPFKLVKITDSKIKNEDTFKDICEHCCISGVRYNAKLKNKVYFIETADNAVVVIPIQLEKGLINIHIDLLDKENIPQSVYDMYMKSGKLTLDQIHFLKPDELKVEKK
jgi:hypothetical protein